MNNIYETSIDRIYRKIKGLVCVYSYGTLQYWRGLADAEIELN